MLIYVLVGNEQISAAIAPWAKQGIDYMLLGTEMAISSTKQAIQNIINEDESLQTEGYTRIVQMENVSSWKDEGQEEEGHDDGEEEDGEEKGDEDDGEEE
jgi:hypothetical protein